MPPSPDALALLATGVERLTEAVESLRTEAAARHTDSAVASASLRELKRRIGLLEVAVGELRAVVERARGAQWTVSAGAGLLAAAAVVLELLAHAE